MVLNALLGKGYEVVVLHVLSPDEVDPPLAGDLRLIDDVETGEPQEVTIDGTMRAIYADRLNSWRESMRTEIMRRGGHYVFIETTEAWEKIVLQDLRRMGLLK